MPTMALLLFGLLLFFAAHLTPALPGLRARLIGRLGENGYKGGFSLLSLAGLVAIVFGAASFRGSAADAQLWAPPVWTRHLAFTLMLPAFILVVAANIPSRLRDRLRNPMLIGVALWALAHLLANGNLLALLLFGSFLVFTLYDLASLSQRGQTPKPPAQGWTGDALAVGIGALLWAATLFWLHPLAGLPLLATRLSS
jgi:uncharacterized membrane protein